MDRPAGGPPVTPRALPDVPPAGDHNAPSGGPRLRSGPRLRRPAGPAGRGHRPPPQSGPYDTGYDTGDNAPTVPMPPAPTSAAPEGPSDSADERARSLLVPVADPRAPGPAAPPPVVPVLPGRPDADRPQVRAPGHREDTGGPPRGNPWWGPGVSRSGQGQWIEVSFAEPTRLLDLVITPGVSARADKLGDSALPHRLRATVTTKDGRTTTRDITLDQGAGGQRRSFRVGDAVRVRLTVETAYATSGDEQVAIAEVEFFGRSSSNTL